MYAFTRCKRWPDTAKGVYTDIIWKNVRANHNFKVHTNTGEMGVSFLNVGRYYILMLKSNGYILQSNTPFTCVYVDTDI